MKYCTQCGEACDTGTKYCTACGYEIPTPIRISKTIIKTISDIDFSKYAHYYYQMGFNVTCISNVKNQFNTRDNNFWMKAPNHKWESLCFERQSLEEMDNYDWRHATGVGLATGFNNLMVIDMDDCSLEFLLFTLNSLDLPTNYEWVVRSGSHKGFHIYVRINELLNIYPDIPVVRHFPNFSYSRYVKKVELLIRLHSILPPSLHHTKKNYEFLSTLDFPKQMPNFIEFYKFQNFIDKTFDYSKQEFVKASVSDEKEQLKIASFKCPNEPHSLSQTFFGCKYCIEEKERQKKASRYIATAEHNRSKKMIDQRRRENLAAYISLRKDIEEMPKYQNWRQQVFTKFGSRCEICNLTKNLQIHHRKSLYSIIQDNEVKDKFQAFECIQLWDVDNGAVLCTQCHEQMESSKANARFSR